MISNLDKIAIRVANSSDISFLNVRAFRALTMEELERLTSVHSDIKMAVIEKVDSGEEAVAKEVVTKLKNNGTQVVFYCNEDDIVTSGISDETDSAIVFSKDDLEKTIKRRLKVPIHCFSGARGEYTMSEVEIEKTEEANTDFDSIFKNIEFEETSENNLEQSVEIKTDREEDSWAREELEEANNKINKLDVDNKVLKERVQIYKNILDSLFNNYRASDVVVSKEDLSSLLNRLNGSSKYISNEAFDILEKIKQRVGVNEKATEVEQFNGILMYMDKGESNLTQIGEKVGQMVEKIATLNSDKKLLEEFIDKTKIEVENEKDSLRKEYDLSLMETKGEVKILEQKLEEAEKSKEEALREKEKELIKANNKTGVMPDFKLKYNGKAKIFTVVGSGSHGVTLTATSLASECAQRGKTLIVDFDFSSAGVDKYVRERPTADVKADGVKHVTGTSLLIKQGYGALVENYSTLVKLVNRDETNDLFFMGGDYETITFEELCKCNFSEFFEFIGDIYDYIVVDLGKLSFMKEGLKIFEQFTKISNKSIVVTSSDKFDIMTAVIKLTEIKMQSTAVHILVNKCVGMQGNMDSTLGKFKGVTTVLSYSSELFNKFKGFSDDSKNRDVFHNFVNGLLG